MRDGLLVGSAILAVIYLLIHLSGTHTDAHDYWSTTLRDVYTDYCICGRQYAYSPVFALAFVPFTLLPYPVFYVIWAGINIGIALWLTNRIPWPWRTSLLLFAVPEFLNGNVHLLLAAAVYAGFHWPSAWALPLLTKVTPGIGLAWFAARFEWRSLAIALGTTSLLAAAAFLLAPELWPRWLAVLYENREASGPALLALPLIVRLPAAILLAAWAARTDRRWLLPVAVLLALPHIWLQSLTLLLASVRLAIDDGVVAFGSASMRLTRQAPAT
ncbi:MAG TPA: glycosyltransferase family 87 protein [Candidatus Limnocylindrales bacterium]|nr:glycosyltransferase family 87 protein [Candidatus Limnocylindrales bacterium]